MKSLRLNRKGQFSIIASLFVAVILISSVMMTYSTIRYNDPQTNPQIISAVDETNLALKQVLGFTVGYYGSILQVTGNSSYAYDQSNSYLNSGLTNIVDVNPKWGTSFKVSSLSLGTNWFTNSSYSQGNLNVTYDLAGLGVYGVAYSISSALSVQVFHSTSNSQVSLTVKQENNQPVVNLGKSSFKFYQYVDSNLTWGMVEPLSSPIVSSDGTYTINIPPKINSQSFIIQVQDARGIMVAASSFSHYTGTLTFNTTTTKGGYYVNQTDTRIDGISDQGTHSNFAAQQYAPNGTYDTLTEANMGTNNQPNHPQTYNLDGSTTLVSGSPGNLGSDDGSYMTFGSYVSSTTSQTLYSHQSTTNIGGTNYDTFSTSGAASSGYTFSGSMSSSSTLLGKVVYSLQGLSTIPANTWTFNYRAWKDSVSSVSYDAQSSYTYTGGTTTFSWSHNVGSGNNRLLVVTVAVSKAAGASGPATVSNVKYNGVTMTQESTNAYSSNSNPQVRTYIFYLVAPTSGSHSIQVTMSASSTAVGGAVSYSSVNQSNPVQTQNSAANYGSSPSVAVTATGVGQAVYASIGTNLGQVYSITDNNGASDPRWSQTGQKYMGYGDDVLNPSVGTVTLAWQPSKTVGYACCAVLINPAASVAVGKIDVNILIRESSGTLRQTLVSGVAPSGALTTSASTLSGTYNFPAYTVVSQTDYLEIDYYVSASTQDNTNAYLMIDNSGLTLSQQTSVGNLLLPAQYTCEAELSGKSDLNTWNSLLWEMDADATVANANAVFQLYNYGSGYPGSGNGYFTVTNLGASITPYSQSFLSSSSPAPSQFRDSMGDWTMRFTVTASQPFNVNIDSATFTCGDASFGLNLEEQWINLNMTTLLHPTLCIDAGTMSSNKVAVSAWNGATWQTLSSGLVSGWNNMSINSYLNSGSTTFTIKFTKQGDTALNTWQVAAGLIRPQSNQDIFTSLTNPAATVAVELLQNGTMIWLGQNLKVTSQTIPVPPVPVKALHVNETINGVNQQVPFQIEDWASSYTVPLGLTNNATVFGNRQMVVFLVNTHVSAFTLWWNGSSQAVQTSLAYARSPFSYNTNNNYVSNGQLGIQFNVSPFTATSKVLDSGTTSTANFMQINGFTSTYGSGIDYVIVNGVVRDIVQQEAEWQPTGYPGGVPGCPNLYANIVLTLPANATYFTYQLSLMFISSSQPRNINELCPISLTSTINQLQTENGTSQGDPVAASGTQVFNATQTWIHHWSQFTNGNTGAGIMYTDGFNHALYRFDSMSPATPRGALSANSTSETISLLPVMPQSSLSFTYALDVSWYGAIVTFDNSVIPIYNGVSPGLWVLAEMPPIIDVTCGN